MTGFPFRDLSLISRHSPSSTISSLPLTVSTLRPRQRFHVNPSPNPWKILFGIIHQTVLERELGPAKNNGDESSALAGGAEKVALILNPYYLSDWGKKKVLGKSVEEGEGLGPRKELFALAAGQLGERWTLASDR